MAVINQALREKLDKYPKQVVELAVRSLELAEGRLSIEAIVEGLEASAREIIRKTRKTS